MSAQETYNFLPKSPKSSGNRAFFQDLSSTINSSKDEKDQKLRKDSVFGELRSEQPEESADPKETKEFSPKTSDFEDEESEGNKEEEAWDDLIVGIDLGTSTTKVSYQQGNSIIMIGNNANMPFTPSVVAFRPKVVKRTVELKKDSKDSASSPNDSPNPEQSANNPQNTEETSIDVNDIIIDDVRVGQDALNALPNKWYTIRAAKRIMGVPNSREKEKENFQKSKGAVNYSIISDHDGRALIRVKTGRENGVFFDVYPQQVSAEVLSYVKKIYKNQFHTDKIRAVLSVPANFTAIQRNMTMEAAKIAGIKVEMLVSEPIAAAIKYLYSDESSTVTEDTNSSISIPIPNENSDSVNIQQNITQKDGIYLVFDFGGGTLDISLVEVTGKGKSFKVLGTEGDVHLGGADVDYILFKHFLELLWEKHEVSLFEEDEETEYFLKKQFSQQEIDEISQKMKNSSKKHSFSPQDKILFRQKLLHKSEAVKESLTVYNDADILFEEFIQQENDENEENDENDSKNEENEDESEKKLTCSKSEFDKLLEQSGLKKRIFDTIDLIFKTNFKDNKKVHPWEVYKVILVGGSCNIPLIKDWVTSYFEMQCKSQQQVLQQPIIVKPDQINFVVSHGAAILAHQKMLIEKTKGESSIAPLEKFFNVNEILSHGIGVECTNDVFWTMISRFSSLPCKVSEVFSTSEDYNTTLVLEIKQGDSLKASENEDLISLVIKDLPARPAQQTKVLVTFACDESGLLHIFASDLENENNAYHVDVKLKGKLSNTKIKEMQNHGITTPIQGVYSNDGDSNKYQEINEKYLLFREFVRLVFVLEHYLHRNMERMPLMKFQQYTDNLEILLKYSNVYHSHQTLDIFKMVRLIKTVKRRIDDTRTYREPKKDRREVSSIY